MYFQLAYSHQIFHRQFDHLYLQVIQIFFINFPHGLSLLSTDTITTQKLIPVEHMKTIEERYSIPSKLVKSILEQMIKQYKK